RGSFWFRLGEGSCEVDMSIFSFSRLLWVAFHAGLQEYLNQYLFKILPDKCVDLLQGDWLLHCVNFSPLLQDSLVKASKVGALKRVGRHEPEFDFFRAKSFLWLEETSCQMRVPFD